MEEKRKGGVGVFIALHLLLMVFSFGSISSKLAAQYPVMSLPFCLYYGLMVVILGVYAVGWQQIIKRLPLTTAYANRAVSVVWGIVWGIVIFHEHMTWQKLLGAAIVLVGVALYAIADHEGEAGEEQ